MGTTAEQQSAANKENKMRYEYIVEIAHAPAMGDVWDGLEVVWVSSEFPENGFSYDDMREGLCRAYVRVTMQTLPRLA